MNCLRYFTLFCWLETYWNADVLGVPIVWPEKSLPQVLKPTMWVKYSEEFLSKVGRVKRKGHGIWQQDSYQCFELAIFRQHFNFKVNIYSKRLIKRIK